MATPVFRREASMASTRIYRKFKIDCDAFKMESTNSKATVLLARLHNGYGDEKNNQALCRHWGDGIRDFNDGVFIVRHDKRVKPNRDAGFATQRGPLTEFSNSGQADRESVSTSS